MELQQLIQQYLQDTKLMQLATAIENQPWVCNVWFAADDDLNIYWFSSITRRHSDEVTKNNKVAAAFALPHTPDDKPRGLQAQGVASVIEDENEVSEAKKLFTGRIFKEEKIMEFMNHKDRPHKFYKIKPTLFVLFDVENFPENPRQELKM